MRTYDFSPLFRSSVGFDRIARAVEAAARAAESPVGHVAYDIEQCREDAYRITLAVAGFGPGDLHVETRENALVVTGRLPEDTGGRTYLYRGLPTGGFSETFQLADHVKVTGAALRNGLLHIDLVREVPEEMRPRQIPIGAAKDGAKDGLRRAIPAKAIEARAKNAA